MPSIDSELLVAEAQSLYAYARRRVDDHQHAEDLVQETLITAWRKRDTFRGEAALSTWLFGIMKFKILDHLRRAGRTPTQRTASPPPTGGPDDEPATNPLDHLFNASGAWKVDPNHGLEFLNDPVEESLHRADVRQWIRHCLGRLPERLRLLVTLREVDDLPVAQAAAAAGVTPGSAAVMLTRARHRLRACLQDHDVTP